MSSGAQRRAQGSINWDVSAVAMAAYATGFVCVCILLLLFFWQVYTAQHNANAVIYLLSKPKGCSHMTAHTQNVEILLLDISFVAK